MKGKYCINVNKYRFEHENDNYYNGNNRACTDKRTRNNINKQIRIGFY